MSRILGIRGLILVALAALLSLGIAAQEAAPPTPLVECAASVYQVQNTTMKVNFSSSASGGSPPYTYYWYVSDGSSSPSAVWDHVFSSPGTYSWYVHINDYAYDTCIQEGEVTVEPCTIDCGTDVPATGQVGSPVSFASHSYAPYCAPATTVYAWSFGDGGSSSLQNPSHAYATAGSYDWTFTVTRAPTEETCTDSGTIVIGQECKLTCQAQVPATGQINVPVAFRGSASATDCTGTMAYKWDFGNGFTSTEQNPSFTYTQPGTWTWSFMVTVGGKMCWQSGTIAITAGCSLTCQAGASPTSGDAPLLVQFAGNATPSGCQGSVVYDWDFGDGSPHSSDQNPSHAYAAPGTFGWTMTASIQGITCRKTGTVTVTGNPGALYGFVAITSATTTYKLDGPGISSGRVFAYGNSGQSFDTAIIDGAFTFDNLPSGIYKLVAVFSYADHVAYDAYSPSAGTYGCPAPQGGVILKDISSPEVTVNVPSSGPVVIAFPPPIVMLHGFAECYQKWYAGAQGDGASDQYWDNYARSHGYISFTPNYAWWGDEDYWVARGNQIFEQVGLDLADLSRYPEGGTPPPWVILGYDMGGLVARALASGPYRPFPLIQAVDQIFLLGVPNSGTDLLAGGAWDSSIGFRSVVQNFNPVFPDFGDKTNDVYAIGGNDGWWDLRNSDGRVPLYSAFGILQQACSGSAWGIPTCKTYASIIFENGIGHIFPYSHYGLGTPASTEEILGRVILPRIQEGSSARAVEENVLVTPESPAGATIWGTTNRTSTTVTENLAATSIAESAKDYPFLISDTDGYSIVVYVYGGSADFTVTDPLGNRHTILPDLGYTYNELNPAAGTHTLTVTPGPAGVAFSASVVEDGTFGVNGYTTQQNYSPGAQAYLRADLTGDLSGVQVTEALAALYTPQGTLIATVTLTDAQAGSVGDGSFGGYVTAPGTAETYPLWFRIRGTYEGEPFQSVSASALNVIPSTHLFTGQFADAACCPTPGGLNQGLLVTATVKLPSQGYFLVSGDLYDADGNFIDHAATWARAEGAGNRDFALGFSLLKAHCVQFGRPFYLAGLSVMDGKTLDVVDLWPNLVATRTYQSSSFVCQPGTPQPRLRAIQPDEGLQGQTLSLLISGNNFRAGARLAFDSGITVSQTTVISSSVISASVTVQSGARLGPHPATVTNADGSSATLAAAFTVTLDLPPSVTIQTPTDGSEVEGEFDVSAAATDDLKVANVIFAIDGGSQVEKTAFPFRASFNAGGLSNGAHTITARAKDSKGQTRDDSVVVYKNPPKITGAAASGSPFKIKVSGANFAAGASLFIGTDTTPWPDAKVKSGTLIVLKGGKALKARFPSGVPVLIRVRNPDGGQGSFVYTRP